jgi:hypothetical protein
VKVLRIAGLCLSRSPRELQAWKLLSEATLYFDMAGDLGHVGIGWAIRQRR